MEPGLLTGRMARERIERLPDDDWRKHDARFQDAVAYPSELTERSPSDSLLPLVDMR